MSCYIAHSCIPSYLFNMYLLPLHLQHSPVLATFSSSWLHTPSWRRRTKSKKIQWGYFLTSVLMFSGSPALWPHPTCCCGPPLWSLGDVRRPEFVGHGDDSKHLAARLLSAHQNKHRRVSSRPPTASPVQLWPNLRDYTAKMHRILPALIKIMSGSKVELGDHSQLLSQRHGSRTWVFSSGGRVSGVLPFWTPVWGAFHYSNVSVMLNTALLRSY